MIGIYKITSPSNKVYIGQSVNIYKRFRHYRSRNESKKQRRLFYSFQKHGINSHKFEVIEICEIDKLNERERYYQDLYDCIGDNGLNCMLTESGNKTGKASKETIEILKIKQSGVNNGMYGRKHSQETKDKIKQKALGRKHSNQARKKMSESRSNRVISEETRKKISIANSGKNHHQYGKKVSEETKLKISKTLLSDKNRSKKIIDTSTGVIYESPKQLAEILKMKTPTLRAWLNGGRKNSSVYKYM